MCPWIIRFPDTVEQWYYKKAQMDLASIYREKETFSLYFADWRMALGSRT